MKMRAFSILICAAMIFSLTACGDSGKTNAELPAMGGEAPMTQQTDEQPADLPEAPETEPEANESEETEPEAPETEVAGPKDPKDILYEKLLSLSFEDGTVYDENGMTVTCEGIEDYFEPADSSMRGAILTLNVSNQNPDNKQMFFEIQDVHWNGLAYTASNYWDYSTRGLKSGSEDKAYIYFSIYGVYGEYSAYEPLEESLNGLGIDISQYPIETVTIRYRVMVGSDSEWEERTAVLKTNEYQDGDFTKYLGEKVGSLTDSGNEYDLYVKNLSPGIIASLILTSDVKAEEYPTPWVYVNGEYMGVAYAINDERIQEAYPGAASLIYHMTDTDDELRKENEIPNDEPIEIQLDFGNGQSFTVYSAN